MGLQCRNEKKWQTISGLLNAGKLIGRVRMSKMDAHNKEIAPAALIKRRAWIWPFCIMLTVFVVSGSSEVAVPAGFSFSVDKLAHFAVFGALATAWIRLPWFQARKRRGAWLAILLVSLYGGLDEWRQSFTPGRFMEFDDWLADSLGALVAVGLYQCAPVYRRLLETQVFRRRATNMPSP